MGEDTRYPYLLTKSVVRIRGQQTVRRDLITLEQSVTVESVAELVNVADQDAAEYVGIDLRDDQVAASLTLRDDRRLASFDVTSTGTGPARLKAVASVGTVLLGAALAFVSPPVGIALMGLGATPGIRAKGVGDQSPKIDPDEIEMSDTDRKVFDRYRKAHTLEADALVHYRDALRRLLREHADAAAAGDVGALEATSKLLGLVRPEAVRVEEHFAAWRLTTIEKRTTALPPVELDMGELPPADLVQALLDGQIPGSASPSYDRWISVAKDYRLAVSRDPIQTAPTGVGAGEGDITFRYRPGSEAQLVTWAIDHQPATTRRDGGGGEEVVPEKHLARRTEARRARVVHAGAIPSVLSLDRDQWRTGKLAVDFNDLGEPTKVSTDGSELLPAVLSELGATVKGGLEDGAAIAKALVSGGAAERQLEIAKAISDLGPLLRPAPADPLEDVKAAVELAELEARLRLSSMVASGQITDVSYALGG